MSIILILIAVSISSLRASSFGAAASLSHLVTGVGFLPLQLAEETRLVHMLRSGRCYQPEEMSEVAELLSLDGQGAAT